MADAGQGRIECPSCHLSVPAGPRCEVCGSPLPFVASAWQNPPQQNASQQDTPRQNFGGPPGGPPPWPGAGPGGPQQAGSWPPSPGAQRPIGEALAEGAQKVSSWLSDFQAKASEQLSKTFESRPGASPRANEPPPPPGWGPAGAGSSGATAPNAGGPPGGSPPRPSAEPGGPQQAGARPSSPTAQPATGAAFAEGAQKVASWLSDFQSKASEQLSQTFESRPRAAAQPKEPPPPPGGAQPGARVSGAATPDQGFVGAIRKGFAGLFAFEGRAGRAEYWYFTAALVGAWLVLSVAFEPISVLLVMCLANAAAAVRRLHDIDRSGHWVWIVLVPAAFIVLILFLAQPGQPGENRFGPPPAQI